MKKKYKYIPFIDGMPGLSEIAVCEQGVEVEVDDGVRAVREALSWEQWDDLVTRVDAERP